MRQSDYAIKGNITASGNVVAHRFIKADGSYSGAGEKALGISIAAAKSGKRCPVGVIGIGVVETGGIFSKDDPITSDSQGRAVKATDFGVASTPTVDVDTALDIDVDTALDIDVETTVNTSVETTVNPTVTVSVPEGSTPVTSTGAQPALTINASATGSSTASSTANSTASGTATNTASGTATNTVSASVSNALTGGVLPVAVNGYAMDASTGAGQFVRMVLR